MTYEVRFLVDGVEHTETVETDSAASAAHLVQDRFVTAAESFELIQVHLLEESEEPDPVASTSEAP